MLRVKLFQDDKIHEYTDGVAERLEASGRCKILERVGVKPVASKKDSGKNSNKSSGKNSNKDK